MNIRPATMDDADLLLAWRNDLGSRLNMFIKPDMISKEEHLAWLRRHIGDPEHEAWIVEIGDLEGMAPIATVRFDSRGDNAFGVGIIVDPAARGCGHGAEILDLACHIHRNDWLFADIKADNVASQRIFERCKFVQIGGNSKFMMYRRKPL